MLGHLAEQLLEPGVHLLSAGVGDLALGLVRLVDALEQTHGLRGSLLGQTGEDGPDGAAGRVLLLALLQLLIAGHSAHLLEPKRVFAILFHGVVNQDLFLRGASEQIVLVLMFDELARGGTLVD